MEGHDFKLLKDIIRGIPELLIVVSEHGQYLEIGGISQHNPDDIVGKSLKEIFPDQVADQFLQSLNEIFECPDYQNKTIEYLLTPSDDLKIDLPGNEPRFFELKINPLPTKYKGDRIAVCICRDITDRKKYEKALIDLSEKDNLTGIFNRTKLFERLNYSFNQYQRYKTPFCFLLFDIDGFKKINDKFGHLAGDQAIRHLVEICSNEHRVQDTFARLGGDEFAMLLPNASLQEAHVLAERIRKRISSTMLEYKDTLIPISISIGLSEIRENDQDIEDLIHRADEAMYLSKYQGRNQVTVHCIKMH